MDELTQGVDALLELVAKYRSRLYTADITELFWNRVKTFLETCAALEKPYAYENAARMVNAFDQANTRGLFNQLLGSIELAVAIEKVREIVNADRQLTTLTAAQAGNLAK